MNAQEEIVISGISGRFPECRNIDEFQRALLRGDDLMSEDDRRFPAGAKGLPKRQGKVPDIDKFDAAFFGLHSKQAHFTDPRQRILLETAYECIIDAGYNPAELKGTKTGVIVGMSLFTNFTETTAEDESGYSILGISHVSAANRISSCFDLTGPSYALDTGCSSSLYAFSQAYDYLKRGEIQFAIVGGAHVGLHPEESALYNKLSMLSPEGKCKVFNRERNGFARSEAVCCYFLQKRSTCRRVYATVLGCKTNTNGYVKEGYTVPSARMQLKLMQELYEEVNVQSNEVNYVEMHGTGSRIGDIIECQSIVDMFCKDRKKPLLIGSVKSNMGHGETASGLAAMTKVLIAMKTGILPANIHMDPIDESLPGIGDKKLQIVTRNLFWNPRIAAINSFGFGGANAHVLLKPFAELKGKPNISRKYRLVQVSGRTEEAVGHFLQQIHQNRNDEDFLSLLDEVHKLNIDGHFFRGYSVIGPNSTQEIAYCKPGKRPIWFIYSGMGSHWPGMGRDLMNIRAFRETFERCDAAVKPYGVDLMQTIMNPPENALENLGNCFTAILAISISLTDLLASIGVKPDYFAGHSLGEVGCAYANGDLTPEQAILLAYSKYHAVNQQKLPLGQMAAVGFPIEELEKRLPRDVYIACRNGKTSATITGLEQPVRHFVDELKKQGVPAKLIYTDRIAFHSKYLMDSDRHMLDFVGKVIPEPRRRSEKWISTSLTPGEEYGDWADYNCAKYHANNYMNVVHFSAIYEKIQPNAIVVEISPNGILQSVIKKELGPENTVISLLDRSVGNQEECLLTALGRLFNAGGQPNLRKLYDEISFPVNHDAQSLSHMVQWEHKTSWFVPYWKNSDSSGKIISINLSEEKHKYLKGHAINGKIVMPAAGFLCMVWKLASETHSDSTLPVVFERVEFKESVTLTQDGNTEFLVSIMKESGHFQVVHAGVAVVLGTIRFTSDANSEFKYKYIENTRSELVVTRENFYKEAHLRKYNYFNEFQGIIKCDVDGLNGEIEWFDNYTSFLDSMLQLSLLDNTSRCFLIPCEIKRVVIDPAAHTQETRQKAIRVTRDPHCNVVKTNAIEICGVKFKKIPLQEKPQPDVLQETFEFVAFDSPDNDKFDLQTSLRIALQIIIQNTPGLIKKLLVGEFLVEENSKKLTTQVKEILKDQVMTEVNYIPINDAHETFQIILTDVNNLQKIDSKLLSTLLNENGFLLCTGNPNEICLEYTETIFKTPNVSLLRPKRNFPESYNTVNIRTADFKWLEKLKNHIVNNEQKTIVLFSQSDDYSGIIGLQKCLMAEEARVEFNAVIINDKNADIFSVDDGFYREQIAKGLALSFLQGGQWGTFVHLPSMELAPRQCKNASIGLRIPDDWSTLCWIEKPTLLQGESKGEIVNVHFSTINPRDKLFLIGKAPEEFNFGLEYSGVTETNRKVMGIVDKGSFSLQLTSHPDFTWDVPNKWTLEEAATVPLAYTKCIYGLIVKGSMRKDSTILIHDATSDIGLAAIAIALSLTRSVFATVGNSEKQEILKGMYPELVTAHIGIASDFSYEQVIKTQTKGKGVDIVVNNLGEEHLEVSLNCLSQKGIFLDFHGENRSLETRLDLNTFFNNYQFYKITLEDIFEEPSEIKQRIHHLIKEGIEFGKVKPIHSTNFDSTQIEAAVNYLSSEKHIGKIAIKIQSENLHQPILAYPRLYFNPDKTYIVIGGLGGIGLELTNWLIAKGATKIILNARRNISNGYQMLSLRKRLQLRQIDLTINLSDTTTLEGAEELVQSAENIAPVGGIFNAAMVLKDANFVDQTEASFVEAFKPKIISGGNLDAVSRKHCPHLDHFVVFSTVWAGRGHIGQTNYTMANSALESLCRRRRADNLPALAVQWGPIGEVGFLSSTRAEQKDLFNMVPQQISSCLGTLEKFLLQEVAVGSSVALRKKKETVAAKPHLPVKTAAKCVAEVLGIEDINSVSQLAKLSQLGLDSLLAAEVKHALYRQFQLDINLEDIRDLTFEKLADMQKNHKIKHKIVENFPPPLLSEVPLVKLNDAGIDNKIILFMIHPIEGYLHYLVPLAKTLSTTVYGLQCTKESGRETIPDTAEYFLELMRTVQPTGPYFMCGYSYGCTLGFEIALQLEREKERVELVLIDGAPDYARRVFRNEEEMKQKIVRLFPALFKQVDLDKIKSIMNRHRKPEDSMASIFESISGETGLDFDVIKNAGEHYFNRCKASFRYQPSAKFTGNIKLIRRLDNPEAENDDYGLQKMCCKSVEVTKLNGDHITILFGENLEKITRIINDWINSQII
ncbi:unnamed protein product [Phyllotreta striolata]|uniref:Fatty acid synthase n=1 Tax=Phyllotreta striolata TaxID=444603 RepID=A0A9P0GWR9_PHYSR|nr:unnamed protein product [Phyllotreta striolata]